jgi:putative phosphotransacetylase
MVNEKGLQSYCQGCGACSTTESDTNVVDEQLVDIIVDEVVKILDAKPDVKDNKYKMPGIPLGVSNHHVHITQGTFKKLFGQDTEFESEFDLYQPGEFATPHVVTIIGPKLRAIQNVRILGPIREYDQVELSLTDAIQLGINAPVKNSGDLKGAAPLTLVGPKSSVYLEECALIPTRHIHMTNDHAKIFGVENGDLCKVRIAGKKSTTFENVRVRVNDTWKLQIHLDTDDANAANVRCASEVEFIGKM